LRNPANKQTNKQMNTEDNVTHLAKVITVNNSATVAGKKQQSTVKTRCISLKVYIHA